MRSQTLVAILAASLLASSVSAEPPDPHELKDQLTGDAKGAAAANPHCKLFTQAEISRYAGAALGPGENAAGGSGCTWTSDDYESSALVQVVPASYFPEPKLVPGFKRLPDVGTRAWVAPDSGWSAGAIVGDQAVVVVVSGKKAAEESAVALLKDTIERRKK